MQRDDDRAAGAGIRLGRIGDTAVLVQPSALLMAVVLVLVVAPIFQSAEVNSYVVATVFALGLYVSILVHEVAHVVSARRFGMRVPAVTLHLMGGETAIEGESRSAVQELVTAGSGPVVSALIGLAGLGLAPTVPDAWHDAVWAFGWVNLLVAAFNALPGLPLDGGRVFRALVWLVTGDEGRGVVWAAWLGRVTAVVLVAAVALRHDALDLGWVVDVALAAVVALFLWSGASNALRFGRRTARVQRLRVDQLVEPTETSPLDLPPDLPALPLHLAGAPLLRAMAARPAETYLVVDPSGELVGLLHSRAVDDAYRRGA